MSESQHPSSKKKTLQRGCSECKGVWRAAIGKAKIGVIDLWHSSFNEHLFLCFGMYIWPIQFNMKIIHLKQNLNNTSNSADCWESLKHALPPNCIFRKCTRLPSKQIQFSDSFTNNSPEWKQAGAIAKKTRPLGQVNGTAGESRVHQLQLEWSVSDSAGLLSDDNNSLAGSPSRHGAATTETPRCW